ncbi:hypothetical protein PM082_006361 [Marasmius tenuissimus]|nr:hypothetical protein PM082_006361 [Marasmius tenuissimus]
MCMDNGFTRFRLRMDGTRRRRLCIHFDYDVTEEMSGWLVQVDGVFFRLGGSVDEARMNGYALNLPRLYPKGALSKSPSLRRRRAHHQNQERTNVYLFVRTISLSSGPSPCSTTTKSLHFWSFSNSGLTPIPPKECRSLGLPKKLVLVTEWTRYSWPAETYEVIRRYAGAKGFAIHRGGMDGSEFVRYLGIEVGWEVVMEDRLEEVEVTREGEAAEGNRTTSGAFGAGEWTEGEVDIGHGWGYPGLWLLIITEPKPVSFDPR